MTRSRILCCWLAASVVAACVRATPAQQTSGDVGLDRDIERLRVATRPFLSLDAAVAAGYPREQPDCLIHEMHGAMGYHHVNRSYLTATPTIEKPQILIYERKPGGAYKLNGVEFIVPYRLYSRDSVAPVLFGQKLHREDNLNIWYLHVWAWTNNRDGLFANFNPDVSCGSEGKVYKPFERMS